MSYNIYYEIQLQFTSDFYRLALYTFINRFAHIFNSLPKLNGEFLE